MANLRRFVITQYKENENIVYDQDFWVKAQNYQNTPTLDIIALWKLLNYQIVRIVENMQDEALQKTCDMTKQSLRFSHWNSLLMIILVIYNTI